MAKKQWDVVVAGGGMSGLSAALSAAEGGADVLLLEKCDQVGGNANLSVGLMWTFRDYDKFRQYIPGGNPELQYLLANHIQSTLAWLENHHLPLGEPEQVAGEGWGRCMNAGRTGDRSPFTQNMLERITSFGARIELRCSLKNLQFDDTSNKIVLKTEKDGEEQEYQTSSLIIATGGFAANRELLKHYLGDNAQNLKFRSTLNCTGDGLLAALRAGADISGDMGTFYGHTMPDADIPPDEFQPITPYFSRFGILINAEGRRFADESIGRFEELNPQIGMLQPGGFYYLIFDSAIYQEYGIDQKVASSIPQIDRLRKAIEFGALVLEASTMDELAQKFTQNGIKGEEFIREIQAYNQACKSGTELHPSRVTNRIPITQPPFYAMKCVPAITGTYGGLRVDKECRILNKEVKPMPGLYACGMDAGGVFKSYYGGGLAWCAVSGRTAGKNALEYSRRRT